MPVYSDYRPTLISRLRVLKSLYICEFNGSRSIVPMGSIDPFKRLTEELTNYMELPFFMISHYDLWGGMLMFRESVYHINSRHRRFRHCDNCPHEFQDGEEFYVRKVGNRVVGYVCKECYDDLFIDV